MRSRTGCFAGCVVVLALVLLYPLVLLAQILIPLALGVHFPWEPPVADEAPEDESGQGHNRHTPQAMTPVKTAMRIRLSLPV
jgi:hypothetical protein